MTSDSLFKGGIETINGINYCRLTDVLGAFNKLRELEYQMEQYHIEFQWWREAIGEEAWCAAIPRFQAIRDERDPFMKMLKGKV